MKGKTIFAGIGAILLTASPMAAQPYDMWKEVNDWKIFVNEETNGCFMERGTPDDYVFHVGTTEEMFSGAEFDRNYFMGFYAPINSGFSGVQEEEVTFTMGPDAFVGEAASYQRENHHGWWIEANNDKLMDDLRTRGELTVRSASGGEAVIDLFELRINDAFEELVECQLQR